MLNTHKGDSSFRELRTAFFSFFFLSDEEGAVQIDVADNTLVTVVFSVSSPGDPLTPTDPCKTYAQIAVGGVGHRE